MFGSRSSGARDERGQVLAIVAGGAMALLIFLGLVIDGGNAFLNRRNAQNAADLSALDATGIIATGYKSGTPATRQAVWAQLTKSIAANDCAAAGSTPCTWQAWYEGPSASGPTDLAAVTNTTGALPNNTLGVRVSVKRLPGTFLARLAGIQTWDVNTDAIAIATHPATGPAGDLLPIALKENNTCGTPPTASCFTPGQVYDLTAGKPAPGGFGWLSWTGSNDPGALSDSICTPNNPSFPLPTTFPNDPGKSNSASVRACLDKWIASGQTVLIPVYSQVVGPGNNATYTIVGIAAFVLTSRDQPAVDDIRGYFVGMYGITDPVPAGAGSVPPKPGDTSIPIGLVK